LQEWLELPQELRLVREVRDWTSLFAEQPDTSWVYHAELVELAWLAAYVQWIANQWERELVPGHETMLAHFTFRLKRLQGLDAHDMGDSLEQSMREEARRLYLHFVGLTSVECADIEQEINSRPTRCVEDEPEDWE
jgi:hypothetical protein